MRRTPSGALLLHPQPGPLIHVLDGSGLPRQIINAGTDVRSMSLSPDGASMYALVGEQNRFFIQVYDIGVLAR
jgi:hypothetical protein